MIVHAYIRYVFYTNRSRGFYHYLVKKQIHLRSRNNILNIYIELALKTTITQLNKNKPKNHITMGEYNWISSRDFSALRIYMRRTR